MLPPSEGAGGSRGRAGPDSRGPGSAAPCLNQPKHVLSGVEGAEVRRLSPTPAESAASCDNTPRPTPKAVTVPCPEFPFPSQAGERGQGIEGRAQSDCDRATSETGSAVVSPTLCVLPAQPHRTLTPSSAVAWPLPELFSARLPWPAGRPEHVSGDRRGHTRPPTFPNARKAPHPPGGARFCHRGGDAHTATSRPFVDLPTVRRASWRPSPRGHGLAP